MKKTRFSVCDSISFEWDGHGIGKAYKLGTLHVWIEDLETNRRWKYRYPIVNGIAEGTLEISKLIDSGTYAFTFMGSDMFMDLKGQVKNIRYKTSFNYKTGKQDTVISYEKPGKVGEDIRYMLMSKKGILMNDVLKVGTNGDFNLPPVIFGDTANLIFDIGKGKNRYWVQLEAPLDSSFTPFYTETVFVSIGQDSIFSEWADTTAYKFGFVDPYPMYKSLQEVTVRGLTKAQRYEKDHVSPMFRRGIDGKTFDGIESDDIARSPDLFTFLQSKVAGLQVINNGAYRSFKWRNEPVQIFIDEMPWTDIGTNTIPTSEIAMIKVYNPPALLTAFNSGGAVAIYTKKGSQDGLARSRFSFEVIGYTQGEQEWW
ncbi:MAG TPA: hypothetical protein VK166_15095 [Chitinophagaceae bacterium]|nr:hypothetical protein [Chitinophagaceae bacterium]